ncbi:MAG: prepilin-type N-terminal cleavage/methylation domain-containing protein [Candidatus Omnitrophica bacterium]|nr:prepilin-type N-terminal cleavage/methylation domain-containing protein [Candidatus Omnitrophota bacterium]
MRNRAFTLIELIVVIAIIAILAAIITPNAFRAIEKSKISKAISDFRAIKSACSSLYSDTGYWPHGGNSAIRIINSDIMRDVSGWAGWDGPYLEKFYGATPWNGTYYFTTNANMGRGAQYELAIEFENACFSGGTSNCATPLSSASKIDTLLDDGVTNTGEVQIVPWNDLHWAIQWDFCNTSSCW